MTRYCTTTALFVLQRATVADLRADIASQIGIDATSVHLAVGKYRDVIVLDPSDDGQTVDSAGLFDGAVVYAETLPPAGEVPAALRLAADRASQIEIFVTLASDILPDADDNVRNVSVLVDPDTSLAALKVPFFHGTDQSTLLTWLPTPR
jgi:hypothetical protein